MNKNSYKKLIRMLNDFGDIVEEKAQKIEYAYTKKAKPEMESIARSVIDLFYEDYEPHKYDRWGDLYNAFKVTVNDKVWKIDYSPKFMKYHHRASNDYIFHLAFEWGYHGGAWQGPDHPESGVPYYRTFPGYKDWSEPAKFADFSPYQRIEEETKKYFKEVDLNMNEDFKNTLFPHMKKINDQINKTFSR